MQMANILPRARGVRLNNPTRRIVAYEDNLSAWLVGSRAPKPM
jgi:hypothetical protein